MTVATSPDLAGQGSPVRRRPLIMLLIAQYLSSFGNAVTVVTVPLYVLAQTGSATATGLAGFASTLPLILAGAIGGVWIDRLGGQRMSVLSDLGAGVLIGLVPVLDDTVGLPMPVLLCLLFGRSLVATPAFAARMSILKPVAEMAGVRTESATTWFQGAPRLGLVLGAPLAALLIVASGAVVGMYVDAATFLVAAALVGFGVPGTRPTAAVDRPGVVQQLVDGMKLIKTIPVIGAMTAFVFVTNLLDDAFTPVILPIYAQEHLGRGEYLGWFLAASGVGAVAGTFLYAPASRRLLSNRRLTLLGCFTVIGVLRLLFVVSPSVFVTMGICLLLGLAAGPLNPVLSTVMLEKVPVEMRGRIFGLSGAVAMSAAPLGILGAGVALSFLSVSTVIVIFGLAYLVLIAVSLPSRALRDMDSPAPAAEVAGT